MTNLWSEICIHTNHEAVDAITNLLHELGAGGVVIEDSLLLNKDWDTSLGEMYHLSPDDFPTEGVNVKAYLPVNSFLVETIEQIRESLNNFNQYDIDISPGTLTVAEMNEEDWASSWKQYYKPVAITDRITITPSWESYEKREDELVIELDPGMAFGTGTHPTTRLCITALEKYMKVNDFVYDVGCGSGVLSIVAAKLGASNVLAFDLDELAVQITKANAEVNQVQDIVQAKQNNLLDGIEKPANIIVANIIAEIIVRFAPDIPKLLTSDGFFIASGIISLKEQEVVDALQSVGLEIIETIYEGDWLSIVAKQSSV
ncbi:ribosomal protein L11 methyltransferase [Desulfuribacillus stibiiarsenatis]|uniref:Ribosomal protein L11 methyltransferase n=1 Tax=Desulfuribacillus stibiiarsenatis TaxID=1390249 RepID=A0A1E5L873_9FIRM|nr:50S ribosomal protein L11 methyltransferase [Desulfuribacillus stibiiarsenatis]OEH86143.1 ribosomal protein L11 methyltransferase [Desulfuribacillus stibiiarsenatis]